MFGMLKYCSMGRIGEEIVIRVILVYRILISPMLGASCRFAPTCSQYAIDAVRQYGVTRGSVFAVWRLLRCHPFSKGGYDPVP